MPNDFDPAGLVARVATLEERLSKIEEFFVRHRTPFRPDREPPSPPAGPAEPAGPEGEASE